MAAGQHVHRVDLHDADGVDHPLQVPGGDLAGRPRRGKALRRDRDPAGLGEAERTQVTGWAIAPSPEAASDRAAGSDVCSVSRMTP